MSIQNNTTALRDLLEQANALPDAGTDGAVSIIERTVTQIKSNVKTIGKSAFANCAALTSAEFPYAVSVSSVAFSGCTALSSVSLPIATQFGTQAFMNCGALEKVVFPAAESVGYWMFQKCGSLAIADFPVAVSVSTKAFDECYALKALCLRNTETICALASTNAFDNSGIAFGDGYIYVPAELVDSYKTATNWSAFANQFRVLEDYTVDGTITGALDESKL